MPSPFDLVSRAVLVDEYTPVLNRIASANDEIASKVLALNTTANVALAIAASFIELDVAAVRTAGHLDAVAKSMAFVEGAQKAALDTRYVDNFAQHSSQTYSNLMDQANAIVLKHMDLNTTLREAVDLTAARPGSNLNDTVRLLMYMDTQRGMGYALGARGLMRYGIDTQALGRDVGVDLSSRTIAGKITPEQAERGLAIEMQKNHYDGLDRYMATHTLSGEMSMVQDAWTRMENAIGSANLRPTLDVLNSLATALNAVASDAKEHPQIANMISTVGPLALIYGMYTKAQAAYMAWNNKVVTGSAQQKAAIADLATKEEQAARAQVDASEAADAAYVAQEAALNNLVDRRWAAYEAQIAFTDAEKATAAAIADQATAMAAFGEAEYNKRQSLLAVLDMEQQIEVATEAETAATNALADATTQLLVTRQELAVLESDGNTEDAADMMLILERDTLAAADAAAVLLQAQNELSDAILLWEDNTIAATAAIESAYVDAIAAVSATVSANEAAAAELIAAQNAVEANAIMTAEDMASAESEAAMTSTASWEKFFDISIAGFTKMETVAVTAATGIATGFKSVVGVLVAGIGKLAEFSKALIYIQWGINAAGDLTKSKDKNLFEGEYEAQYTQNLGKLWDGDMHLSRRLLVLVESDMGPKGFSEYFGQAERLAKANKDERALSALDALRPQAAEMEKHWGRYNRSQMDNLAGKIHLAVDGSDSSGFPEAAAAAYAGADSDSEDGSRQMTDKIALDHQQVDILNLKKASQHDINAAVRDEIADRLSAYTAMKAQATATTDEAQKNQLLIQAGKERIAIIQLQQSVVKSSSQAQFDQYDMAAANLDTLRTKLDLDTKLLALHHNDATIQADQKRVQADYLTANQKEYDLLQKHAEAIKGKTDKAAEYLTTIKRENELLDQRSEVAANAAAKKQDDIISRELGGQLTMDDMRSFGLSAMSLMQMGNGSYQKHIEAMQKPQINITLIVDGKALDKRMMDVKVDTVSAATAATMRNLTQLYENGSVGTNF
jgi:hypothetical protein